MHLACLSESAPLSYKHRFTEHHRHDASSATVSTMLCSVDSPDRDSWATASCSLPQRNGWRSHSACLTCHIGIGSACDPPVPLPPAPTFPNRIQFPFHSAHRTSRRIPFHSRLMKALRSPARPGTVATRNCQLSNYRNPQPESEERKKNHTHEDIRARRDPEDCVGVPDR